MSKAEIVNYVLRAAKDNDAEMMKAILQAEPAAAKMGNAIQQTGLHVAAIWGCVDVARVLLAGGALVNAQNQFGATPLASAVQSDRLEMVKMLLESGADTSIVAANGAKVFECAKSDAMRILLGAPALKGHAAVNAGDADALEALLREGALDVSDQDSEGQTLLHLAVGHLAVGEAPDPILSLLLKYDSAKGFAAAQRMHNNAGLMPLHLAAGAANSKVCDALLRAKTPDGLINACSLKKDGMHNGQWGKKNEAGKIVRLSRAGSTALHLAVTLLRDEAEAAEDMGEEVTVDASLVRLLLSHGADPNTVDEEAQTPLHIAISVSLHEVVQLLCEAKADLGLGCKAFGKNNTALHQAVILRDVKTIQLLTAHGADVDAPGRDGWTPLCMAVRSNAIDSAKALLNAKADVHAAAGNGKTPLEIANLNSGRTAMIELLQAS